MRILKRRSLACIGVMLLAPYVSLAQGANVDVTVIPNATSGTLPAARDGFTVCIGTMSDFDAYGTQLTPANGVANTAFKNLPVGQQVVIRVNKTGYVGLQRLATLQADWSNHIQFQPQPGTGGPSCPAATTSPTPPPPSQPPTSAPPTTPTRTPPTVSGLPVGQLSITSFYMGGPNNPPTLQYGFTTPVHISPGPGLIKPGQVRISERPDFSDAAWQPIETASYKLAASGRRTFYAQTRSMVAVPAILSNVLTDVVDVAIFSTTSVSPPAYGIASRDGHPLERVRLQCSGRDQIISVTGRQGAWLDAIGIRCPGNASVGPVGNLDAPAMTVWDVSECPAGTIPNYLPIYRIPMSDFMQASKIVGGCVINPVALAGPLPAQAIAAPTLTCPQGTVPIAIDAYLDKVAVTGKKYVAGLGLICIKPGA